MDFLTEEPLDTSNDVTTHNPGITSRLHISADDQQTATKTGTSTKGAT